VSEETNASTRWQKRKLCSSFEAVLTVCSSSFCLKARAVSRSMFLRENGSGAKFVNGAVRLRICDISDRRPARRSKVPALWLSGAPAGRS